ncbi:MAG TPA: CBS domain-containing protein, partial [Bacillales bacterium]|nr:CBS domain-containing protein [Bacillales bacterium]
IMNTDAATVTPEESYASVAEIFSNHGVRTIPVLEDGCLLGLITRSSMMRGLAGKNRGSGRAGGETVER